MEEIKRIKINKNRGWRGLAELIAENEERKQVSKAIFSFSQNMWEDMLNGFIVIQDTEHYIVLAFDNTEELPKPTQQRSVLIKNFTGTVVNSWAYAKNNWVESATVLGQYDYIKHFLSNNNKHTTSDWNCIGIRVVPML